MQNDAEDQKDHGKRDERDKGLHLKFSDPPHALIDLAMKKHSTEA